MPVLDTSAWLHWDPSPVLFTIPFLERQVAWYGCFFALGFVVGYFLILKLLQKEMQSEEEALEVADRLLWLVVLGTVVGARLGHVFFYDWPQYYQDPISILKVWEGGLASHGGAVGVTLALLFFRWRHKKQYPDLCMWSLGDCLVIPTAFAAACIRIGNFFNQEIVGTFSTLPWAIVFGHPADGSPPLPRHPVQLYESLFYFLVFALLYRLWKWEFSKGVYTGLFFSSVFTFRFFIEIFKRPQSQMLSEASPIMMGQLLSVPFAIFGFYLLFSRNLQQGERRRL